ARPGLRPPRWAGPNPVRDVASPGALRTPAPRTRAGTVTLTDAALTLGGALVAGAAALWAGLLALGEEAAVGEALHTLGDAPPATVGARVPLHRALHVARLALLVLGAVAAGNALGWWGRPWAEALGSWAVAATFLFIVGDALPRSLARVAPELAATALPLARRTLAPFGLLLWLLAWVHTRLHRLVGPRPSSRRPRRSIASCATSSGAPRIWRSWWTSSAVRRGSSPSRTSSKRSSAISATNTTWAKPRRSVRTATATGSTAASRSTTCHRRSGARSSIRRSRRWVGSSTRCWGACPAPATS